MSRAEKTPLASIHVDFYRILRLIGPYICSQEQYASVERLLSSVARAKLALACGMRHHVNIDFRDLSASSQLDDDVMIAFADKLHWPTVCSHNILSLAVTRTCHRYFMNQHFYSFTESNLAGEMNKISWAYMFNYSYAMNIDYSALSEERLPEVFIDMFGEALDWKKVLETSSVPEKLLQKFKHVWCKEDA